MIKNILKKEKGISLVALVITITVILILSNVIIYNIKDNFKIGNIQKLTTDIENLRDKISSYYTQYGNIPAKVEYPNIEHLKSAKVISEAVDTGRFLVIDLSAIENLTLNYGKDYEDVKNYEILTDEIAKQYTDLYIINETSHNIFYVRGIKTDQETYYTDIDVADTESIELRYVDNVKIPDGFYYVGGSIDEGIVISDVQGDDLENTKHGNQFVWVPVPDISKFIRAEGYINKTKQNYLQSCSEPFIDGYETEKEEYDKMVSSVTKNGGFYIGRFEAGKVNNEVVVQKDVDVYNNIKWGNAMDDATGEGAVQKSKEFKNGKAYEDSVTSTLIYGVQWDATMQFFDNRYIDGIPTNDIANSYVSNSAGKGNYNEEENTNKWKGQVATTGSLPEYSIKNIYDMAGNVSEWTMEAYNTDCRVNRGGNYNDSGSNYPSSRLQQRQSI